MAKKPDLNKKYDSYEDNKEKIEAECEIEKREAPCSEILRRVPLSQLDPATLNPDSPYTDFFVPKEKQKEETSLKDKFLKFLKPKEEEKDIFDICMHDPPCNLECLYGRKLVEEEEKPDPDTVKGLVYTKGGAVYETIAYRLPDEFGWEPQPGQQPKQETPFFENKKKKKKKPEIMEFTGPVKIIVVDREGFLTSYAAKRIHAAFIQLSYILIGCTVMCIYFFALKYNFHYSTNIHIISCLVAFQYCLPAALLMKDKSSIAGCMMSSKHQFRDALIMKTFAIVNIFGGVGVLHSWRKYVRGGIYTAHALPGYAACAFAVAEFISYCVFSLLLGYDRGHVVDCYLHILTVLALVYSLWSFYLGITLHPILLAFIRYKHWYYWAYVSAVIFALVAVFRPCMDCLFHLWRYICVAAICLYRAYRPRDPCTPRSDIDEMQKKYNPYGL